MKLTGYEIQSLETMVSVYRNDCERKIRRIRRNMKKLQDEYDATPKEIIEESCIQSPKEEIDFYRMEKSEAILIGKKLAIIKSNAIKNGEWN